MRRLAAVSVLLALICLCGQSQAVTFENSQIMSFGNVGWGDANSVLISKTDQGALGVDLCVVLGDGDYGKLSLGKTAALSWAGETDFYLRVELIEACGASESIELNPFLQTGSGWVFAEDKDGVVLGVGDSYVLHWDISGVADLGSIKAYGFQLFTAGDIENPEQMAGTVRVTPIPEPATISLLCLGTLGLINRRKKVS